MNETARRPAPSQHPPADARRLRSPTVVKLGGSLARDGAHETLLETITELVEAGHEMVVVPGGGVFADAVRCECGVAAVRSTAAHWMAILAMDQMAYLLSDRRRRPGAAPGPSVGTRNRSPCVVRGAAGAARALEHRRVPILAPFRWLRTADPLPHSWDVTSDSIAAWVADQLNARRLIVLKSVDGICDDTAALRPAVARMAIEAAVEAGSRVLDPYFARALAPNTECWIINGRRPERLRALVAHDATIGTVVC